MREDVAGVEESHAGERFAERPADQPAYLGVGDDHAVAAEGQAVVGEDLVDTEPVELKASNARAAARVEPLTRGQVPHAQRHRIAVGVEDGLAVLVQCDHAAKESAREAYLAAKREHGAATRIERVELFPLCEQLDVAN